MHFAKNIPGVNPVVMNYKIKHNKNWLATRSARYSLVWPKLLFPLLFVVVEKKKNTVWACEAMCKGSHGGRLAQSVS